MEKPKYVMGMGIRSKVLLAIIGTIFLVIIAFSLHKNQQEKYEGAYLQSVLSEGSVIPRFEYKGQTKLLLFESIGNENFWFTDSPVPFDFRSKKIDDIGGIVIRSHTKEIVATYPNNITASDF